MPIAFTDFSDELRYNLKVLLKTPPLCFTLSGFNMEARNSATFRRPMVFLPTVDHGKSSGDETPVDIRPQDEHNYILSGLQLLVIVTQKVALQHL